MVLSEDRFCSGRSAWILSSDPRKAGEGFEQPGRKCREFAGHHGNAHNDDHGTGADLQRAAENRAANKPVGRPPNPGKERITEIDAEMKLIELGKARGEIILVANVLNKQTKLTIGRIEVDKSRQTVKAFGPSGELVAFFPATVGSEQKPTPSGSLKVVSVDANPNYRYNPDYKFKGVKSREAFTIKPGPNNPVGSYWIGLSAEGFGIHGTPNPSKVSKSESHGCVRLTNWDVGLLGSNIKKGTPVVFVDPPQQGGKS